MVKRTEIALLFKYNDNWIGGSYYIINIIKALNLLSDDEKPRLILYYDSEAAIRQIADIHYPDIEFRQFTIDKSLFKRAVNRISKAIFKQLFFKQKIDSTLIKNFYPVPEWMDTANIQNYYYWIPDFQERYLPGFFSKTEIAQRIAYQKLMVKNNYPLIFSSNNARADFDKFYPENSNKKKSAAVCKYN